MNDAGEAQKNHAINWSHAYHFQLSFSVIGTGSSYINLPYYARNQNFRITYTSFQELKPPDDGKRLHSRHWICNNVLDCIFFFNEAWFQLSGYINMQNFRSWSSMNSPR